MFKCLTLYLLHAIFSICINLYSYYWKNFPNIFVSDMKTFILILHEKFHFFYNFAPFCRRSGTYSNVCIYLQSCVLSYSNMFQILLIHPQSSFIHDWPFACSVVICIYILPLSPSFLNVEGYDKNTLTETPADTCMPDLYICYTCRFFNGLLVSDSALFSWHLAQM